MPEVPSAMQLTLSGKEWLLIVAALCLYMAEAVKLDSEVQFERALDIVLVIGRNLYA